MKKYACITIAFVAMLAASSARAEMPAGQQGAPDPQAMEAHKAEEALMFKDRKGEILLHINNEMAELQKKKSCIEAAADKDAMMACMPHHPMMGGPGEGHMMGGGEHEGHMMMGGQPQQPPSAPGSAPQGH